MIPLPDLSLKSCKTVEEQERRRQEYERQKEEKRIRYEAAKLRMKIARRRRAQERARRRKMRKTQHELIMIKARDTMLHCQRTARVCIEVEVVKQIRKAERRRQKMEMELMEQELLKALGLSENSNERKIEELPPEMKD